MSVTRNDVTSETSPQNRRSRPLLVVACGEFWRGLTTPSLTALLTALSVTAALVLSCFVFIRPCMMASGGHRYFALTEYDTYNSVTGRAISLSRARNCAPAVFFLGTSADEEALTSCDQLAQLVAEKIDITPVVHDLTMAGQTHWEMAALTDMLPEHFDGVVLLGLGVAPPRFLLPGTELAQLVETPRLGFVSEAFDREISLAGLKVPERRGNYFWDNRKYFAMRIPSLFRNILTAPPVYEGHTEFYQIRARFFNLEEEITRTRKLLQDYGTAAPRGLAVFERIAQSLKRRGRVAVVIMQSPANPQFIDKTWGRASYNAHKERMHLFAAQHRIFYWDLTDSAALTADDFYDWTHIQSHEAKKRYMHALAQKLAELLGKTAAKEAE